MKIEEGRRYITRDGQVVGPLVHMWPNYWIDGPLSWRADGRYDSNMETPMDLIAVAPDQPAPGPSAFVRETAARIMASDYWRIARDDGDMAKAAVAAAIALEKALQEAGQ